MKTPSRWPVLFLAVAVLVVILLGLAGWRLLEQERSLEKQRNRERLENAGSLVVRESERAISQASRSDDGSLVLAWDERGLWRVSGASLPWSPAPPRQSEAPAGDYAAGEALEFGASNPERAMAQYRAVLTNSDNRIRAGALARIARCQRKLQRRADALETYSRLAALGATPVMGAPAELVSLRERAVLFEAGGANFTAAAEWRRLRSILAEGRYPIDRGTFLFYAGTAPADDEAGARAEAAEQLWKRAADSPQGVALLTAVGRPFLAEWSLRDGAGAGRLVRMADIEKRVAAALESSVVSWQLEDASGNRLAGGGPGGIAEGLRKRAAETGLPWDVRVNTPELPSLSSASLVMGALSLLGFLILGSSYLAWRAVRGELRVAHMQSEFVAAVSHEFRTPITALTHLTEMLEGGDAAEERKPLYYAALSRETRRLREMVENLLDFGRLDAGRYKYRPETLDPANLVRHIVEEFALQPAASGRQIVFERDERARPISADREALRRAVWNLLDNAAKYSPAGTPVVARVESRGGAVGISIRDEGPGISHEERKEIFQKFVRGRSAREGQVKGTGIGLAMVQAITEAHGGRVHIESEMGMGSRFILILPAEAKAR